MWVWGRDIHDYALFAKKVLSRGFHVRASSLPVETHCEDGGWIQPGLHESVLFLRCNKDFSALSHLFCHIVHEPFLLIHGTAVSFPLNL